jgi:expansin (peptidoglycan-binding protein)
MRWPLVMAAIGLAALVGAPACDDAGGDADADGDGDGDADADGDVAVDPTCTSLRLTSYEASSGGWCEFDRTLSVLPSLARQGLTTAVAEPWAGGSFGGAFGEACGECWEIATSHATQIVMVHDLCPIEGNPICAGSHFHFDLSQEAGAALGASGLDAAQARVVPCPVEGNIAVQINNWNQWGYMRAAFVNHRVALRAAELRMAPDGAWVPFERSGGAWQVLDGPVFEGGGGPGVNFRFTSASGEVVTSSTVVPFQEVNDDLGNVPQVASLDVQFAAPTPSGDCPYEPPGVVYGDGWGGIDQLRWGPNPWTGTTITETSEGCWNGSASCLRIDGMGDWSGLHLAYWNGIPADAFERVTLWARTLEGTAQITIGPSFDGTPCAQVAADLTPEWVLVVVAIDGACDDLEWLSAITAQNPGPAVPMLFDEIRFE